MTVLERQPIQTEEALGIIEHVNDDHQPELLLCARAFTPFDEPEGVRLTALYPDGIDLEVLLHGELHHAFISYEAAGAQASDVRALVGAARQKLGLPAPGQGRKAEWTVTANQRYAGCFQRITFHLEKDTRDDWEAGYACRFAIPGEEHGRPYTLRRVEGQKAVIDVYIHDASVGSRWALGLDAGHAVTVTGGRHESFPDFSAGPVLLLGDETALPTIAGLLASWNHDQPVRVLLEVADAEAQRYLDDVWLPRNCHVSWLPRRGIAGQSLLSALEGLEFQPAAAWGAGEFSACKRLRHTLQEDFGLEKKQARMVGYWRKES